MRGTTADVTASEQAGGNIAVYDCLSVVSLASDSTGEPFLPATPERYAFDCTTDILATVRRQRRRRADHRRDDRQHRSCR